jgi:hypothetical protein
MKPEKEHSSTTIEIPMINKLGVDGPIPQYLRERLAFDLETAQCILGSIREICEHGIGDSDHTDHALCAAESMAYRVGRLLEPWTGTGYFGDDRDTRIDVPVPAKATPAAGVANG